MTTLWRAARGNEPAYTFFVHLTATQAGAHGQLGILEPEGSLSLREVETADCHTVLTALAFIPVVMADPLTPPPSPNVPAPVAPVPPRRRASREQAQTVKPWHLAFGPSVGFEGGIAPRLGPTIGVHAELSHTTGVILDPSARLSFRVAKITTSVAAGSAEFTWQSARLALCPLRLQPFSWLDIRPCALLDAGSLSAQGYETVQNKGTTLFWSAAGGAALVDVLHLGRLTLGAEAGAVLPFRHDGFYFDTNPDAPVHTIPSVSGNASVYLSVRAF
ncbi:MAG: hypothetical protein ACOY0T_22625 [Myxococcota bacterium]